MKGRARKSAAHPHGREKTMEIDEHTETKTDQDGTLLSP